jgi:DNA-binding winged helix-turn-helix (wHTH) protein
MPETQSLRRLVRFGAFEADLRTGELRKDGVKLKFSGQPFQVLAILLERPGEVVTREELQKRLWPDTFVDVERNLNTAVNKIREVLGDSAETPRFVETLPRRGYRFVGPVDGASEKTLARTQAILGEVPEVGAAQTRELPTGADSVRTHLSVPVAVTCLIVVLGGIAGLCFLRQRVDIINQIPMDNSSEVLAAKARDIAKSLGYAKRPVDTSFGWNYNEDYLRYVRGRKNFSAQGRNFGIQHPPAVFFWLRESDHYLVNFAGIYAPKHFERDTLEPGMLEVLLDSEGRLIEFHAFPQAERSGSGQKPDFDWDRLFVAAGLDPSRFTLVQPLIHPQGTYDLQAAWTGSWETNPQDLLRVETAAYLGKPISFRIIGPWTQPDKHSSWSAGVFSFTTFLFFLVVLPIGGGLLARRNARLGRGDQRGAFRLAGGAFLCMFLGSVVGNNHAPTSAEITTLFSALRDAFVTGVIFWVLYTAAELVVRRQSPATLIAWNQFLNGRLRDPAVGGEMLVGLALGTVGECVLYLVPIPLIEPISPRLMPNAGAFLSLWCWIAISSVCVALTTALVLNLLLRLVRRQWLAVSIFVVSMTTVMASGGPPIAAVRSIVLLLMIAYALTRFGVLAAIAFIYVHDVVLIFPLTTNTSAWYAPAAMLAIGSVMALAIYAFQLALSRRRLWNISFEKL